MEDVIDAIGTIIGITFVMLMVGVIMTIFDTAKFEAVVGEQFCQPLCPAGAVASARYKPIDKTFDCSCTTNTKIEK